MVTWDESGKTKRSSYSSMFLMTAAVEFPASEYALPSYTVGTLNTLAFSAKNCANSRAVIVGAGCITRVSFAGSGYVSARRTQYAVHVRGEDLIRQTVADQSIAPREFSMSLSNGTTPSVPIALRASSLEKRDGSHRMHMLSSLR